jgi:hypothetical protein
LGSDVAEDGRARIDANMRIQKARGSFNACMNSVLLYGCETWLVTSEI